MEEDAPACSLLSPGDPTSCFPAAVLSCKAFMFPPELLAGELTVQPGAGLDSWRRGDAVVHAFVCSLALGKLQEVPVWWGRGSL